MKIILIFLLSFISFAASAQTIVNGGSTKVQLRYPIVQVTRNFIIPVYADTTTANTNIGKDSLGALIQIRTTGKVYHRDSTTGHHKWTEMATNSGTGVWGSITGHITDQLDLDSLLNTYQLKLIVGTSAQYIRGDYSIGTFPTDNASFTNSLGFITSVLDSNSITGNGATTKLQLSGDQSAPGVSKYYGTNSGGTKGWYTVTSADTTSLSARINLKVNISDTSAMLGSYLRKTDTSSLSSRINLKINISDSAAMLSPYMRKFDTTAMLAPYQRSITALKFSDTTSTIATKTDLTNNVTLTATQIGYGNGSSKLTGSVFHTWDNTNHIVTVTTPTTIATVFPSFVAQDTTTVTSGQIAYGGAFVSQGNIFSSGSKEVGARIYNKPISGSGGHSFFSFETNVNNGSWTQLMSLSDANGLQLVGLGISIGSGAASVDASGDGVFTQMVYTGHTEKYRAVTATDAVLGTDDVLDATSGTFTETLPTAGTTGGRTVTIINTGAGTVTVGTTGSQNIVGTSTATTYVLGSVGKYVTVCSGVNRWVVIANN
jgi:hypothetical protein